MESLRQIESLGDVVDLFPEELGEPQVRQRLRKLADELDELLSLDESGELMVDQDALLRIARNWDGVPAEQQDLIVRETQKHLGQKLKKPGRGRHLGWRDAAQHGVPIRPEPAATLHALGIGKSSSVGDVRRILRERYPDIPSFWLEADAATIRETTLRALAHNLTLWDCMVGHLGYWGALATFAAVGSVIIVCTATGPWGGPLALFLIATLGSGTAFIVFNCLANPNW